MDKDVEIEMLLANQKLIDEHQEANEELKKMKESLKNSKGTTSNDIKEFNRFMDPEVERLETKNNDTKEPDKAVFIPQETKEKLQMQSHLQPHPFPVHPRPIPGPGPGAAQYVPWSRLQPVLQKLPPVAALPPEHPPRQGHRPDLSPQAQRLYSRQQRLLWPGSG